MDVIDGIYVKSSSKELYVKQTGNNLPAIIIEPGMGSLSAEWTLLQYELSKITSVITYDRSGYAESPEVNTERSGKEIVEQFYTMIKNTGIPGPYIFVAHSTGALYTELFARTYPHDAGAIIFVDPYTKNFRGAERLSVPKYNSTLALPLRMANLMNYSDMEEEKLENYVRPFLEKLYPGLPEEIRHQLITYQSEKKFYKTIIAEYSGLDDTSKQISDAGEFPDIPIKIISRDPDKMVQITTSLGIPKEEAETIENFWHLECKGLTRLTNQSEFKIAKGADSNIHFSNPKELLKIITVTFNEFGGIVELGKE